MSLLLNERVAGLAQRVERLDRDMRDLDRRLVRVETLADVAQTKQGQ